MDRQLVGMEGLTKAASVLKGKMQGDIFECENILLKCPSKYKDEKKQLEKSVTRQ